MTSPYPKFPLYVPTKGRSQYMVTSKYLTEMGVRHYVVVEPQEVDEYRKASKGLLAEVLPLDMSYKDKYETCDNLGLTRSTGPGPARNFAWDHSVSNGYAWHWVMDDNLKGFYRLNKNLKVPTTSPAFWSAMEDFCLRYRNVAMAGPNYFMFASRKNKMPPFVCNTRIYSCNLIRNDVPFRWRGRWNEDTILSLDMLSAKWCTIQFNAFLQFKMQTQAMKGGNTDEFYLAEGNEKGSDERYSKTGTTEKSQMLVNVYPKVAKLAWRFGRVHHTVDYRTFRDTKLVKRKGIDIPEGVNNYGMSLVQKEKT